MSELSDKDHEKLKNMIRTIMIATTIKNANLKEIEDSTDAHIESLIKDEIIAIQQDGNAYNEDERMRTWLTASLTLDEFQQNVLLVKLSFFVSRYIIKEAQDRASKERIGQIWDSINPLK